MHPDDLKLVQIPRYRLTDPGLESLGRVPPEFLLYLCSINGITPVVTRTICDEANKAGELVYGLASEGREDGTDEMDDVEILQSIPAPDVVCLPHAPTAQDKVETSTVILDIQPVADVGAVAIYRNWSAFETRANNGRNEFLFVLERAVVIGAVGGRGGQSIAVMIRPHQMI